MASSSNSTLGNSVIIGLSVKTGIAFLIILAGIDVFIKRRRQRRIDNDLTVAQHVPVITYTLMAPFTPLMNYFHRIKTHEAPSETAMSEIGGSSPVYEMHRQDTDKQAGRFIRPNERH
jgi:hypothetical protein